MSDTSYAAFTRVKAKYGKRLTEKDYKYSIEDNGDSLKLDFDEEFDGDDADFMYIEFEGLSENFDYALYSYHDPVFYTDESKLAHSLMKKIYNDDMTVTVTWTSDTSEEFSMTCNMDEGKLLLPLGAARGWLLNNHSYVTITVKQNDEVIAMPNIADIKMLKAREVQ